ncbi:unnamed protein product [Boreogadus saida]
MLACMANNGPNSACGGRLWVVEGDIKVVRFNVLLPNGALTLFKAGSLMAAFRGCCISQGLRSALGPNDTSLKPIGDQWVGVPPEEDHSTVRHHHLAPKP